MHPEMSGYMPQNFEIRKEVMPVQIVAVTDLGPNDEGSISNSHLPEEVNALVLEAPTNPEYRKPATNRWRCVDGRTPEGGVHAPEGFSDLQLAGGLGVNETSVDVLTDEADTVLSETVARNVRTAIQNGQEVIVHGDNHVHADEHGNMPETNKEGCGANKHQRYVMAKNAENAEIIAPNTFALAQMLEVQAAWPDENALKDDILDMIKKGAEIAANDTFWDITPAQVVDVAVANGAKYEELVEEHLEVAAIVELGNQDTFDEEAFMAQNSHDGKTLEVFVASLGHYKKYISQRAESEGLSELWAARRIVATVLMHIGTLKKLTNNIPIIITK